MPYASILLSALPQNVPSIPSVMALKHAFKKNHITKAKTFQKHVN